MSAEKFLSRLQDSLASKYQNCQMMNNERYDQIFESLTSNQRTRESGNFVLQSLDGGYRLLRKKDNKIVVPIEQYYEIIKKEHEGLGHAGRDVVGKGDGKIRQHRISSHPDVHRAM